MDEKREILKSILTQGINTRMLTRSKVHYKKTSESTADHRISVINLVSDRVVFVATPLVANGIGVCCIIL